MLRVKTAVVGVGHLGHYHAQKLTILPESTLVAVCDSDAARATFIGQTLGVPSIEHYQQLLGRVDAVVIAASTAFHFEIAHFFLRHGVHVLLEKPMTLRVEEADQLIASAHQHHLKLQIGHIERFNPVSQALQNKMPRPFYFEASRSCAFKKRGTDISVILDMMIHDIDFVLSVTKTPPAHLEAYGAQVQSDHVDVASARFCFADGSVAQLFASRLHSHAERQWRLFGDQGYILADLHAQKMIRYNSIQNELHTPPETPHFTVSEDMLLQQTKAFLQAILQDKPVVVDGAAGRAALHLALAVEDHIKTKQKA